MLLRARTVPVGVQESEAGTFTDQTRPTGEEVEGLIATAVGDVAQRVGENMPNTYLLASAKSMAILRTAMLIELSYFPEQVESNRSPFAQFKDLFDEGMVALVDTVGDTGGGGSTVESGFPAYGFPADQGGMVGWQTAW